MAPSRRQIAGIGVDTLSLNPGRSQTFDVHVGLLGADRYGIENLANLGRIPARGRPPLSDSSVGGGLRRPRPCAGTLVVVPALGDVGVGVTDLGGVFKLDDFEELARKTLSSSAFAYYAGGAGDEITLRDNVAASGGANSGLE